MTHVVTGAARPAATGTAPVESALSDADFLAAFESCTLGADSFRHVDHIRLAWIYLCNASVDEATAMMGTAIRRFALHHTGSTAKYNAPLTEAWMRLVARARATSPDAPDFSAFARANPMLFDRARAFDFYGEPAP